MVKWGMIIFCAIVAIALGGILQAEVCDISQQDLGIGAPPMKILCGVLSIPIDWIILILAIIGITTYFLNN